MPHLLLSSCLFPHHLFQFTCNIMIYYVFQLDSPWCLFSLPVSYNSVCRFSISVAEELAPNVWQSVKGKQGEPDEKRDSFLAIYLLSIIISEKEVSVLSGYVRGLWWWYNFSTIKVLFFSIGKLKVFAHSSVQGQFKKWANAMFPW